MRILALSLASPLPADTGDAVANLGLLRALSAAHETRLITVRRSSTTSKHVQLLKQEASGGLDVFDPLVISRTRVAAIIRQLKGFALPMPPRYLGHWHPFMTRVLQEVNPRL